MKRKISKDIVHIIYITRNNRHTRLSRGRGDSECIIDIGSICRVIMLLVRVALKNPPKPGRRIQWPTAIV